VQLIEPYLSLPIASKCTATLSKYTGLCDAFNKALLQVSSQLSHISSFHARTRHDMLLTPPLDRGGLQVVS
jgi:hypothetical protein